MTCAILHNLQNTNLQTLPENSILCNFQVKKIKKIDLDFYVNKHQWFMVAYIILCNLQNTNLQILPAKTLPANPTISD